MTTVNEKSYTFLIVTFRVKWHFEHSLALGAYSADPRLEDDFPENRV